MLSLTLKFKSFDIDLKKYFFYFKFFILFYFYQNFILKTIFYFIFWMGMFLKKGLHMY